MGTKYGLAYLLGAFGALWVAQLTLEWGHRPILCSLPVASYTKYCLTSQNRRYADFPGLTRLQMTAAKEFRGAISGGHVWKDVLRVERAAVELIPHVRISELLNRGKIADELQSFAGDLRGIAKELQLFSSEVAGTINDIAVLDEWALRTIEDTKDPLAIVLLKSFGWQGDNQEVLSTTYARAFEFFSSKLEELIVAADELVPQLDFLYMRLIPLDTDISAARKIEDAAFDSESDRGFFDSLFIGLGFMEDNLPQIRENLELCRQLKEYIPHARDRIDEARDGLLKIRGDLKEVHKRTFSLSLENAVQPLELQLKSLQKTIEELRRPGSVK